MTERSRDRGRVVLLTLLAGLVCSGTVLAGSTLPASAAAAATTATVSIRSSSVQAGKTTVLSVRIHSSGQPTLPRRAVLQQRVSGTQAWKALRVVQTDSAGRVSVRTGKLLRSKDFRLRYQSGATMAASNVVSVVVPTWISAVPVGPATPIAGAPIIVTGSTSPQLAGARIHLQTPIKGVWKSISSAVVASDATYTVRAIATRGGDQQFRALVREAPGRAEAISPSVDYTVYAWYRVAELAGRVADGSIPLTAGRAVIGSDVVEQSLTAHLSEGDAVRTTFALDERCTTFRARIGATGHDFSSRWRLIADDEAPIDQILQGGEVAESAVDITGASTVSLVDFGRTGTGTVTWGNPELLCAGRP